MIYAPLSPLPYSPYQLYSVSTEAYEYYGLMAETWDLFRGDTSQWEDRFFYLEVIKEYGGPVLDVGCGTGRLLLDFLAQGIAADGVDNSPEMLALCRQKAGSQGLNPNWKLTGEKTRPAVGALARRWSRAWYDVEEQLEHTEERYEVTLDGQVIEAELHRQSPATRWYTQAQAEDLYRRAGFGDLRLLRGFTFQPATPDDEVFTIIGQKPR